MCLYLSTEKILQWKGGKREPHQGSSRAVGTSTPASVGQSGAVDLTKPVVAITGKPPPQCQQPTITQAEVVDLTNTKSPHCQARPQSSQVSTQTTMQPSVYPQSIAYATHMMKSHHNVVQPSYPRVVVPPVPLPPEDEDALLVSNGTANSLERFFLRGAAPASKEVDGTAEASDPLNDSHENYIEGKSAAEVKDGDLLSHMKPISHLSKGIPYHHLSVSAKLTMLEFLLDELLQVPEISAEFARRHDSTLSFHTPFGVPPLEHEYEEMYNADECTVCGIEGDLLCCDGCPGSFHRGCIGMSHASKLPEGKWLCPECRIIDGSKMVSGHVYLRCCCTLLSSMIAEAN